MLLLLTDREKQVLRLIADGLANKEISCELLISESTVENHIHNIYRKLGISKRAQAVVSAFQLRIVPLNEMIEDRGNPS